jgi:hypothetical protein
VHDASRLDGDHAEAAVVQVSADRGGQAGDVGAGLEPEVAVRVGLAGDGVDGGIRVSGRE